MEDSPPSLDLEEHPFPMSVPRQLFYKVGRNGGFQWCSKGSLCICFRPLCKLLGSAWDKTGLSEHSGEWFCVISQMHLINTTCICMGVAAWDEGCTAIRCVITALNMISFVYSSTFSILCMDNKIISECSDQYLDNPHVTSWRLPHQIASSLATVWLHFPFSLLRVCSWNCGIDCFVNKLQICCISFSVHHYIRQVWLHEEKYIPLELWKYYSGK